MGGPQTPAIGFALGFERILRIIKNNSNKTQEREGVFFVSLGDEAFLKSFMLTEELRSKNIKAQFDYAKRSLKAQMRYANKALFKYVVVIGDNEIKQNSVDVKNLDNGEVVSVGLDQLGEYLF